MNKLVIPSSPNWYETDIMACTPDNTLIYGSRQDLIVIKPTTESEPDDVNVITKAHSMRIKSVNVNRNWGEPHKYATTVAEDKVVKLWDIETLEKKSSHNKHMLLDDTTKVIGASFAGDDRIVSISETGTVVIWNLVKNETTVLDFLFSSKVIVTCLSVCPHATWLAAIGLKSGLIIVADFRRTGKILYKLRGHNKAVVSLSWCPAPVNIFPLKPQNRVIEKKLEDEKNEIEENKDGIPSLSMDNLNTAKYEVDELLEIEKTDRRKQKNPKKAPNSRVGSTLIGDEQNLYFRIFPKKEVDFLQECRELREQILSQGSSTDDQIEIEDPAKERETEDVSAIDPPISTQDTSSRAILKPRTKKLQCNLSNILHKQKQQLQIEMEAIQTDSGVELEFTLPETHEPHANDTPTDRRELSMEISHSCGRQEPASDVNSILSDAERKQEYSYVLTSADIKDSTSESSKLDITTTSTEETKSATSSSETNKTFSSASSCDNGVNCSKRPSQVSEPDQVRKSNSSSTSESGDVFHDAQVCEMKASVRGGILEAQEFTEESSEDSFTPDAIVLKDPGSNLEDEQPRKEFLASSARESTPDAIVLKDTASNLEDEQPRKEFLLASSARESYIYIWRAGTDGRMQTFLPVHPSKNQKKTMRPDKVWITICWVAPHILLSSSRTAELLQWNLPKPMNKSKSVRQIHKDHWSVLFSIKTPILYFSEYNFLQQRDINVWTTGMERNILNTDIQSMKNLSSYPTLGGSVNCLRGSPFDPNRLAFGTGEGIVNVWDLSREHKKRIEFSTFYQKIMSSVTVLAWHPNNESVLALATVEGRIALLDTVGKGKSPKILAQYFKNEIFKMEWGPLNGDIQTPGLFVVSEAKVAVFDPKEKEPRLLELPDNTSVYTISWKPDYSLLLVASKTGSLISYSPDLKISNISYLKQKLHSIVWNPNAATDDAAISKYTRTFVSIVKNTDFVVYDLSVQSDNFDDKMIAHFENRKVVINSIEWNPYVANQLVFVDAEAVSQVYDIETKTVLSSYVNPYLDPVLSVCWSPLDQDYIITGTIAHKIIVWKVSEHSPLTEKEINTNRNKLIKVQNKATTGDVPKEKTEVALAKEPEESKSKKSTAKSSLLPMFYSVREKTQIQDIRKLLRWKLGDRNIESNIGDGKNIDVLDVFADRQGNMERVLNLNITSFRQQGKHQNGNLLTLFQGDIGTAIKEAIAQQRVNPWIISMCPMVSPKLWQTACETYTNQLLDESEADPLEIVTYLLACHKVEESVNVLCERALFREAFVLARARFGADNPIVSEILDKWAKSMVYQGNFELAAQCYISLGKFEDAASVLFRRSNVELLGVAAELAKLSGNEELHKAVLFRYKAFETDIDQTKESDKTGEKSNEQNDQDSTKDLPKEGLPNKNDSDKINDVKDPSGVSEKIEDCTDSLLNVDVKEYLESQKNLISKLKEASHIIKNDSGNESVEKDKEEINKKELEKECESLEDKNALELVTNVNEEKVLTTVTENMNEESKKELHENTTTELKTTVKGGLVELPREALDTLDLVINEEKVLKVQAENMNEEPMQKLDKNPSEEKTVTELKETEKGELGEPAREVLNALEFIINVNEEKVLTIQTENMNEEQKEDLDKNTSKGKSVTELEETEKGELGKPAREILVTSELVIKVNEEKVLTVKTENMNEDPKEELDKNTSEEKSATELKETEKGGLDEVAREALDTLKLVINGNKEKGSPVKTENVDDKLKEELVKNTSEEKSTIELEETEKGELGELAQEPLDTSKLVINGDKEKVLPVNIENVDDKQKLNKNIGEEKSAIELKETEKDELGEFAQEALETVKEIKKLNVNPEFVDAKVLSLSEQGDAKKWDEFLKKTDVVVPNLIKERGNELQQETREVLEAQEKLLSSDEVKKLLSTRRVSTERDVHKNEKD